MSSGGENTSQSTAVKTKRRRLHGACDLCRQKKIRCDSAKMAGNQCSTCVAFGSECTHVHINQKIGHGYRASRKCLSSQNANTLSLAQLRASMDPLLKTILFPTYQAPTNPSIIRETVVNLARYVRALEAVIPPEALDEPTSIPPVPRAPSSPSTSSTSTNEDPNVTECIPSDEVSALAQTMQRSFMLTGSGERFFGPSSSVSLLKTAIELSKSDPKPCLTGLRIAKHMRPQFWSTHPWERPPPPDKTHYEFPDPDLMTDLIELFFGSVNYYLPLLHRPTFDRSVQSGLHLKDRGFGMTLLGVCALASRYSDDERVFLEDNDSPHSSGYKWFRQMDFFRESLLRPPSLYEIQALCLGVMYLHGSSAPERCWYLVGFAIRGAQDVGFHRKSKDTTPTVEGELRKRAFYFLLIAEGVISTTAGRTPGIQPADYDVDLPVVCDDEYWANEDPSLSFKQPIGKPSKISYFNCLLTLAEIHCRAQRAFYAVRNPDPPTGISMDEYDRATLTDLDSALNAWVDSVPEHLRWDPHNTNVVFLDQSAMLFVSFYHTQILVHRPFITSVDTPGLAFSSLAICTNAARASSRIMETQSLKGLIPLPQVHIDIFVAGLVLLLGIWRGRRTGFALMDEDTEMSAVQSCINVLEKYEDRDILMSMLEAMPFLAPRKKNAKRNRGILENESDQHNTSEQSFSRLDSPDTPIRRLPTNGELGSKSTSIGVSQPALTQPQVDVDVEVQPALEGAMPVQFPFYSSDLSKPFFSFNPAEDAENPALKQQLDDLEAMIGQATQLAADGADPLQTNQALDQLFGFSSSFTVSPSAPTAVPKFDGAGSAAPPMSAGDLYGPTPEQNSFNTNIPDAEIWSTGLLSGNSWDDWNTYMSNVEALNNMQGPFASFFLPSGSRTESPAVNSFQSLGNGRNSLPNAMSSADFQGW